MSRARRPLLLSGPYRPPRLKVGDRAFCLFRDCDVLVTSWTDGPIPWPRCRALGTHGGGSGLLLDEELARAVRSESSQAIQHWWSVTEGVVWRWRKALGVGRWEPEGSRQLHHELSQRGAAATRERVFSAEERAQYRQRSLGLGSARFLRPGYHGPRWTEAELSLLGKRSDEEVSRRTGRSVDAVRQRREEEGIPNPTAQAGDYHTPNWSAEEDKLVRQLPPQEAARRTGRTINAVYIRRSLLGVTRSLSPRRPLTDRRPDCR